MQVQEKRKVTFTVKLTAKEALALKTMTQNYAGNPDEESEDMRQLRYDLFNALPDFDELYKYQ